VGDSSACLPLKATVTVESTQKLPAHYDMNSIVMDLMKDPKAKEVIAPLISGAAAIFGDGEGGSEAANEAVTEEMSMAMMQYMPLRSMLGFSNGAVTGEMIDEMLKKMNE
jgi:beta-glucosidase